MKMIVHIYIDMIVSKRKQTFKKGHSKFRKKTKILKDKSSYICRLRRIYMFQNNSEIFHCHMELHDECE